MAIEYKDMKFDTVSELIEFKKFETGSRTPVVRSTEKKTRKSPRSSTHKHNGHIPRTQATYQQIKEFFRRIEYVSRLKDQLAVAQDMGFKVGTTNSVSALKWYFKKRLAEMDEQNLRNVLIQ